MYLHSWRDQLAVVDAKGGLDLSLCAVLPLAAGSGIPPPAHRCRCFPHIISVSRRDSARIFGIFLHSRRTLPAGYIPAADPHRCKRKPAFQSRCGSAPCPSASAPSPPAARCLHPAGMRWSISSMDIVFFCACKPTDTTGSRLVFGCGCCIASGCGCGWQVCSTGCS